MTRRPEHEQAMYELSLQAEEDIPGIDSEPPSFAGWRAGEIERPSKPAEFTFVALEAGEVVGYAALNVTERRIDHGLTVVRGDRRRRGIAGALKRTQIAKAIDAGFEKLYTESEERNVAMRTLNDRLGYAPLPALIVLRGPEQLAGSPS